LPVVCILLVHSGCSQPLSVEQQVIAVIREMEARIEAGERRQFMDHIAEQFSGQGGDLQRQELRALVIYQLNRYQRLHAQLFPIHVVDTGDNTATASYKALVTGGPSWIPEGGQLYQFETRWEKDGDDWLLTGAEWKPIALEDALE
jgi:hypothetical protein